MFNNLPDNLIFLPVAAHSHLTSITNTCISSHLLPLTTLSASSRSLSFCSCSFTLLLSVFSFPLSYLLPFLSLSVSPFFPTPLFSFLFLFHILVFFSLFYLLLFLSSSPYYPLSYPLFLPFFWILILILLFFSFVSLSYLLSLLPSPPLPLTLLPNPFLLPFFFFENISFFHFHHYLIFYPSYPPLPRTSFLSCFFISFFTVIKVIIITICRLSFPSLLLPFLSLSPLYFFILFLPYSF